MLMTFSVFPSCRHIRIRFNFPVVALVVDTLKQLITDILTCDCSFCYLTLLFSTTNRTYFAFRYTDVDESSDVCKKGGGHFDGNSWIGYDTQVSIFNMENVFSSLLNWVSFGAKNIRLLY